MTCAQREEVHGGGNAISEVLRQQKTHLTCFPLEISEALEVVVFADAFL